MPVLIHVNVPLAYVANIQPSIEQLCQTTGDQVIGRRIYDEVGEVLLVVHLFMGEHLSHHIKFFNGALHNDDILSFQIENIHLLSVECPLPYDIRSPMSGYPLQPDESWFPSIANSQIAYLCTPHMLLKTEQVAWFHDQQITYQYL